VDLSYLPSAAAGVYPPQMKVFELDQLSMKFERHMDAEAVQFHLLSGDWYGDERFIRDHSPIGLCSVAAGDWIDRICVRDVGSFSKWKCITNRVLIR